VSDLDIDIGLLPGLRLEFLPDHLSLGSLGAETHPTFELVIGAHIDIEIDDIQLQNDLLGSPVRLWFSLYLSLQDRPSFRKFS
jgi:hypothetical protein